MFRDFIGLVWLGRYPYIIYAQEDRDMKDSFDELAKHIGCSVIVHGCEADTIQLDCPKHGTKKMMKTVIVIRRNKS